MCNLLGIQILEPHFYSYFTWVGMALIVTIFIESGPRPPAIAGLARRRRLRFLSRVPAGLVAGMHLVVSVRPAPGEAPLHRLLRLHVQPLCQQECTE